MTIPNVIKIANRKRKNVRLNQDLNPGFQLGSATGSAQVHRPGYLGPNPGPGDNFSL